MMRLRDSVTLHPIISGGIWGTPETFKARVYRAASVVETTNMGAIDVGESIQMIFYPGRTLKQGDKVIHRDRTFYVQGTSSTHYVKGKPHHCTAKLLGDV